MTPLSAKTDALAQLMEQHLGVGGSGFEAKLRRAGRRLPRWARRDGRKIVEAMTLEQAPKLARRVDQAEIDRSVHALSHWLKQQDPWAGRKAMALSITASVAFVLLAVVAGGIAVMVWRGLI